MSKSKTTLEELRKRIEEERGYAKSPFSRNVVSRALRQISELYGQEHVDKAVTDLELEKYGWRD